MKFYILIYNYWDPQIIVVSALEKTGRLKKKDKKILQFIFEA